MEQKPGLRLSMRWWDQNALYILGIRSGHTVAEGGGVEIGTEESEGEEEG